MTFRLLAVDLDGTLVRRDGTIHDDDVRAIERLRAAGVPTTIVTGRLFSGARAAARAVGVDGAVGCMDGSQIVHCADGASAVDRVITGPDAILLRGIMARRRMASFLLAQDAIVHDHEAAAFAPYARVWSPNMTAVDRLEAHPYWEHERGLLAVVAVGPRAEIASAVTALRAELAHAAHVVSFAVRSHPGVEALVVRAVGCDKGTAVAWLAERHGCSVREVVAVGDWWNDVPMFRTAGRSFAMRDAPPAVQQAATDHLDVGADTGGGVAAAIAQVWDL